MSTRWDTPEVAGGFDAYDDLTERTLGYPAVFRALRLGDPDVRAVLDFGCGPGKVAERVVTGYGKEVIAVDGSARCWRSPRAPEPILASTTDWYETPGYHSWPTTR